METVNQLAKSKSQSNASIVKEDDCNCKGKGQVSSADLTAENKRVLRLLTEHSTALKNAVEDAILKLGIAPEKGERFQLTGFKIIPDTATSGDLSPWGPYIAACCPDGAYDSCYTEGCDPCEGHY